MAKPVVHAKSSAKRWGGPWQQYVAFHQFLDRSKAHLADVRHRALFHHREGVVLAENMLTRSAAGLGHTYNKAMMTDLGEQHVREDLGFYPEAHEWVSEAGDANYWLYMPAFVRPTEKIVRPFEQFEASVENFLNSCPRFMLHNSLGPFIAEEFFGQVRDDGWCARTVAERHIFAELGRIPSVQDVLEELIPKIEPWMAGLYSRPIQVIA
jgi:hypothetical protein